MYREIKKQTLKYPWTKKKSQWKLEIILNNSIKICKIHFNTAYLKVIALHAYIRKEERLKIKEISINFRKLGKEKQ